MVVRAVCEPSLSIYIKLAVEGANGTDFPEPARRRQEHENDKHTKLITTTPKWWDASALIGLGRRHPHRYLEQ